MWMAYSLSMTRSSIWGASSVVRSQQAHASCYCMALSHILGEAGTPPKKLETSVTVTLKEIEGGWKTGSSQITVKGTVPGIDEITFKKAAEDAKDGCPISNALKGNVASSRAARSTPSCSAPPSPSTPSPCSPDSAGTD